LRFGGAFVAFGGELFRGGAVVRGAAVVRGGAVVPGGAFVVAFRDGGSGDEVSRWVGRSVVRGDGDQPPVPRPVDSTVRLQTVPTTAIPPINPTTTSVPTAMITPIPAPDFFGGGGGGGGN